MKKVLFLGLLSLAISYVSAQSVQTENPAPDAIVVATEEFPTHLSIPDQPVVNNGVGVNNTINIYPQTPPNSTGNVKKMGKTGSSWKNNHHGYCQWNYFRQIELQNENRDYWKGKYEGLREGFGFENQKAPAPPTFPTEKDWSEEIFWLLFVLGVIGLVMYLSNRNTPPSPAAPAAAPVIVYPPAPAPPAPTLPVPPTSSELMKLMKENGGKFTVGSDGSWAADVYEQKKEKSATEAAAIDVKEEK